jgi:large subunit ribosomal protein L2
MKKFNSYTSSMRHVCLIDKNNIVSNNNKNKLINNLILYIGKKHSGRNNSGHITVFSKGTRHDRFYRYIDYKRNVLNVPGIIHSIHYDPNRSAFISLVFYKNGIVSYIISVHKLCVGEIIYSRKGVNSDEIYYNKGDNSQLLYLPISSVIHNLELWPNNGGIYIRSAGTYGIILKKLFQLNKVLIELPSKNLFYASIFSKATLGIISNPQHNKIILGKAGRKRWLGIKSIVRGVAMNPVDHPHGGGEGKRSDDAFKKSPWGKVLKWRNKKKIKLFDLV